MTSLYNFIHSGCDFSYFMLISDFLKTIWVSFEISAVGKMCHLLKT